MEGGEAGGGGGGREGNKRLTMFDVFMRVAADLKV